MQVDKGLKGALFSAREDPVDGTFLVSRQMVFVESGGKVAADRVSWLFVAGGTEAVGDELQVLFEMFLRPCPSDELNDAFSGVVPDAPIAFEKRNDAVVAGPECLVLTGFEALIAAVRVNQPLFVDAIAAHDASNCVGKDSLCVFFLARPIECYLLVGNIGRKLLLQPIGFQEDTVVSF